MQQASRLGDDGQATRGQQRQRILWLRLFLVFGLLALVLPSPSAISQVGPGASLTVVRGTVSVSRPDGTAIYPAGTGLTLAVGDIVGTLDRTRAILTFFTGSEVELGSNTTVIIRRLDRDLLDQAYIDVEHVQGMTLIRVPPGSPIANAVRVLGRDTITLVRAGEVGHGVDPESNNVTAACVNGTARCDNNGFAFPNEQAVASGQTSRTVTGTGDFVEQRVRAGDNIWDILAAGGAIGRGDGTDGPQGGRKKAQDNKGKDDDDDKPNSGSVVNGGPDATATGTPTLTPTATTTSTPTATLTPTATSTLTPTATSTATPPSGTPGPACSVTVNDDNSGNPQTTVHNLGVNQGSVTLRRDAFGLADRFQIFYEGAEILDTGFVTGQNQHTAKFGPGASTFISVVVTPQGGSVNWEYSIDCIP